MLLKANIESYQVLTIKIFNTGNYNNQPFSSIFIYWNIITRINRDQDIYVKLFIKNKIIK